MSDFHISTKNPDGHTILTNSKLQEIERTSTQWLFHFAGPDHSITLELDKTEADITSAALKLLELYPTLRKVTT
jgi:hypothetical protein